MSLQQKIDRITDILRRDDGISGAMHYTEQTSWILFLKFLDDYEAEKAEDAILSGEDYAPVLDEAHHWSNWACPKTAEGKLDIQKARTGDDLRDYVNNVLFPYLKSFRISAQNDPQSFGYKIGAIFEYLDNKIASAHTLREVLDIIDSLNFQSETELFELSEVYERLLQNMGDAGGYAGEFYTPRALIRTIVKVIDPQAGQTIYDAAAGSCGFLIEAFEHLKTDRKKLTTKQWDFIQQKTFFGFEKTSLAYVMGMMNMILHGIEGANLELANTLELHSSNVPEKDKYSVILSNPPYGGKMDQTLQTNFRVHSSATECLFVQHIMANLARGGRAGVVIPEGVLFRGGPDQKVRKELLEQFNVHTILSLPAGCFLPYTGVKTNVIFFNRPKTQPTSGKMATKSVWFYELTNDGFELKQTRKPIEGSQIPDFLKKWKKRVTGENSWTLPVEEIVERGYDLSAKNPNRKDDYEHRPALELVQSIKIKEERIMELLGELEEMLEGKDEI